MMAVQSINIGLNLDISEYPEDNIFEPGRTRTPDRWEDLQEMALTAEAVGFDSLWIPDHLIYRHGPDATEGAWECCAMVAALAAVTHSVEIGTLVICTAFRNPALLAKMADTIDEISGGRFILGLGAGWHEPEFREFGYPFDHLYSRFRDALLIIHGLLRDGTVDFKGDYYEVRECELRPRGPRPDGPPLLIGAKGSKMSRLAAQYADIWQPLGQIVDAGGDPLGAFNAQQQIMHETCTSVGRDPETLQRMASVVVNPLDRPAYARTAGGSDTLGGSPEQIAAGILQWRDHGASHLYLSVVPMNIEGLEAMAPVLDIVREATTSSEENSWRC